MSRRLLSILSVLLFSFICVAQNPLDQIWRKVTQQPASNLTNDKIISGLKEALKVSTTKAVAETGRPDGFLGNEAIKILLPGKLQTASKTLRLIGQGAALDELEVGMNRAAEQATPLAKQIFLNALMKMSINDARQILSGNETAATEYFRRESSEQLATAFAPIVHKQLQNVGVVQQYDRVMSNPIAAQALRSQQFDLNKYVVGKSLDGLFYMMGEEEKQIRKNPAARTTQILKDVFGSKLASK
jgi:Protein of unknown function (DUF4197)